jgi:bla regulator protein BlaR1
MNTILAILDALINTLWQAVVVAALVWLALRFMPRMNAATRHAIWWATLAVVLILPVVPRLTAALRPHRQSVAAKAVVATKAAAPPVTIEPLIVPIAQGRTAGWPLAVLAIWAAIFLWRTFQILRSYVYLRGIKRRSAISPMPLPEIPRRATLLISPDIVSPMAVGFLRPAVVLPESLLAELSEAERNHVLLHESAHLARHDDWANLAMRILGGVLALHPVAIWILRRIEREREMACDDWVVARIGSARPYAASLARMVELRQARRGQMLASGIFGSGSFVGNRIEILLRQGRTCSPRLSVASVAPGMLVLGALLPAASFAPRWIAFAQAQSARAFDVATVKPVEPDDPRTSIEIQGDRLIASATLKALIGFAWDVQDRDITAGPGWIGSIVYHVEGKSETLLQQNALPQTRQMLQSLLADRFSLAIHRQTRDEPVYHLLLARGGAKLKPSSENLAPRLGNGRGRIGGTAANTGMLARMLSGRLGRPVIDKTGLNGNYDFALRWNPAPGEVGDGPEDGPAADPGGPSIFSALQEQLGLKLESGRGPVEALVIDHVEKPDAN